ncbi:MAG: DinB family protein [Deltaproteobacteria bacterium]|nr:DinB family protein [Deltaproteobacteria bacterium]
MATQPEALLREARQALEDFVRAADRVGAEQWDRSPGEGKWSPSQIVEHVQIGFDIGTKSIDGRPIGMRVPRLFRPLVRRFFLLPTIKKNRFPMKSKAPAVFQPTAPLRGRDEVMHSLRASVETLLQRVTEKLERGEFTFESPVFGRTSCEDYIRFQIVHVRHHQEQLVSLARR